VSSARCGVAGSVAAAFRIERSHPPRPAAREGPDALYGLPRRFAGVLTAATGSPRRPSGRPSRGAARSPPPASCAARRLRNCDQRAGRAPGPGDRSPHLVRVACASAVAPRRARGSSCARPGQAPDRPPADPAAAAGEDVRGSSGTVGSAWSNNAAPHSGAGTVSRIPTRHMGQAGVFPARQRSAARRHLAWQAKPTPRARRPPPRASGAPAGAPRAAPQPPGQQRRDDPREFRSQIMSPAVRLPAGRRKGQIEIFFRPELRHERRFFPWAQLRPVDRARLGAARCAALWRA
jgi:hypothetical protein